MGRIRRRNTMIHVVAAMIPVGLSILATAKQSLLLVGIMIVCLFVIVKIMPEFKKKESIWMFLLVALAGIPVNVYCIVQLFYSGLFAGEIFILNLLRGILMYMMLFCVEEVAMGVLTRIVWRRQNRVKLK